MHIVLLFSFYENRYWASLCAKKSSKHGILNLYLKSRVVIELEYMSVLTLQCITVVKTFWVLMKILGFKYSA